MRQLLTDASRSLIALRTSNKAISDGGNTEYLTTLYVLNQPVLLNVSDEPGDDNAAGVWQGMVLGKTTAAAEGENHAVKKRESFR